jgi:hypothetical protein
MQRGSCWGTSHVALNARGFDVPPVGIAAPVDEFTREAPKPKMRGQVVEGRAGAGLARSVDGKGFPFYTG